MAVCNNKLRIEPRCRAYMEGLSGEGPLSSRTLRHAKPTVALGQ